MAYKVFSNGDALTGGELNTFLMNQSVISFATTTARDAALTAPLEGQLVWLEDSNKYVYYSGSAWVDLLVPASSGNAIINGAMDIWQRGSSFTNPGTRTYTADRYQAYRFGFQNNITTSRVASGLTGFNFAMRNQRTSGDTQTGAFFVDYNIESVNSIPFAGQSVTLSFYARAGANYSAASNFLQISLNSGTGTDQQFTSPMTGAAGVFLRNATLTTSWQRFTFTGTVPSNSNQLCFQFTANPTGTAGANDWFDITGVQLESGTSATPFRRNANSIQGELAACQRYYQRYKSPVDAGNASQTTIGFAQSSTQFRVANPLKVTMRTVPSSLDFLSLQVIDGVSAYAISNVIFAGTNSADIVDLIFTTSGLTTFRPGWVNAVNAAGFLGINAEL